MGKYTFTYTKKEFMEFCIKSWWDMRRSRPVPLLAFLSLFLGFTLILKRFPYEFLFLLVILITLEIRIIYTKYAKKQLLKERSIWIENGILKCHTASAYHEAPCCQISRIIESKRLLMLGIPQTKNQTSWFIIPTRVFSCAKEQYDFLQALKNPVSVPVNTDHETEDFHFSFFMDTDKWIQLETEAHFVFRERDSHNSKTVLLHLIYYIFLYIICICTLYLLNLENIFSAVVMIFFVALLPLGRSMISPEKSIRKKCKTPLRKVICWEIGIYASHLPVFPILLRKKAKYLCLGQSFHKLRKQNKLFIFCAKTAASSSRFPKVVFPVMNRRWLVFIIAK